MYEGSDNKNQFRSCLVIEIFIIPLGCYLSVFAVDYSMESIKFNRFYLYTSSN